MKVTRADYIPAPPHEAVYATGHCYTGTPGRLLEAVRHEACQGDYYFAARIYRRVSDDQGRHWTVVGPVYREQAGQPDNLTRTPPAHVRDPRTGHLLALYTQWQVRSSEPQFCGETTAKTYRIYQELSTDEGRTWAAPRPVVQAGPGFDEQHWLAGIEHGRNGAVMVGGPLVLDDGTVVCGYLTEEVAADGRLLRPHHGYWYAAGTLRGRWNADGTDLTWEASELMRISPELSSVGLCEMELIHLGGNRLLSTHRCQGIPGKDVPSSRYWARSDDGGRTWTSVRRLCYDDGSPVFVPAAFAESLRSPRTGKFYWFTNILDHPVPQQVPRYPLTMAEWDPEGGCIRRGTVRAIQELPPGAPVCTNTLPELTEECGRRYTNFGAYVDAETGEFVLTMPEQPKTSWADFTSDCIQFRISE